MLSLMDHFKTFAAQIPSVSDREIGLYENFFQILVDWNQRMALVSKKSIELSFANHFVDSLFISDFGRMFLDGDTVFDLGSGAGFPGLVFAIRNPEVRVALYEKLLKKQTFLNAVVSQLQLKNVSVQGAMPERQHNGLVLARAVMPPDELFPFLHPRMSEGAVLVVNIGGQTEKPEAPKGFQLLKEKTYPLPLECGSRRALAYKIVSRETKK
ncbi:hypothetical protein EBR78_09830 [bacterium]|nr:hypothetical protein [bacterium]